jgi:hypothetical protein
MGIMNYYGNQYPLTWQLEQVDKYLMTYEHPQLVGFSLWLHEYMGTNADDWSQWNNWIVTEIPEFQPFIFMPLLMAATLLIVTVCKKTRLESVGRKKIKFYAKPEPLLRALSLDMTNL